MSERPKRRRFSIEVWPEDESLLRACHVLAARRGVPIRRLVLDALRAEVDRAGEPEGGG